MEEAAVGICIKDGKVLLLRRSNESKTWPGYYSLPGGHLEKGETFEEALQREYVEETGRKLTSWAFLEDYEIGNKFIKIYKVEDDGTPVKISDEHDAYTLIEVNKALDILPMGDMTRNSLMKFL